MKHATLHVPNEALIRLEAITKIYPMGAEIVRALNGVDLENLTLCAIQNVKACKALSDEELAQLHALPCGDSNVPLAKLLTKYLCRKCKEEYWYSFCWKTVAQDNCTWHCDDCQRCRDWRVWHCELTVHSVPAWTWICSRISNAAASGSTNTAASSRTPSGTSWRFSTGTLTLSR